MVLLKEENCSSHVGRWYIGSQWTEPSASTNNAFRQHVFGVPPLEGSGGMLPRKFSLKLRVHFLHSGDILKTFSGCLSVTNYTNKLAMFKQTLI